MKKIQSGQGATDLGSTEAREVIEVDTDFGTELFYKPQKVLKPNREILANIIYGQMTKGQTTTGFMPTWIFDAADEILSQFE